jgi:5'-nucleotidase
MRILVSNDDGYQAEGIECLAKKLSEFAEIIMVAPDRNRSGASNSLTLDAPLRVREYRKNCFYVNGTPTDCVHLAVNGFFAEKFDMVVSGINCGYNLGDDVLYSGTVAAAMEGRFLGLPAIAVSVDSDAKNFATAAHVAKELVLKLKETRLPPKTILNVNIPNVPLAELGKYEVTRLGARHAAQDVVKEIDPRGNEVYWIGLAGEEEDAGVGTDFFAINSGKVSITPLQVEWTNYEAFEKVSGMVSGC